MSNNVYCWSRERSCGSHLNFSSYIWKCPCVKLAYITKLTEVVCEYDSDARMPIFPAENMGFSRFGAEWGRCLVQIMIRTRTPRNGRRLAKPCCCNGKLLYSGKCSEIVSCVIHFRYLFLPASLFSRLSYFVLYMNFATHQTETTAGPYMMEIFYKGYWSGPPVRTLSWHVPS